MTIEDVNHWVLLQIRNRSPMYVKTIAQVQKVLANTAQWSALVYGMSNRIEYE